MGAQEHNKLLLPCPFLSVLASAVGDASIDDTPLLLKIRISAEGATPRFVILATDFLHVYAEDLLERHLRRRLDQSIGDEQSQSQSESPLVIANDKTRLQLVLQELSSTLHPTNQDLSVEMKRSGAANSLILYFHMPCGLRFELVLEQLDSADSPKVLRDHLTSPLIGLAATLASNTASTDKALTSAVDGHAEASRRRPERALHTFFSRSTASETLARWTRTYNDIPHDDAPKRPPIKTRPSIGRRILDAHANGDEDLGERVEWETQIARRPASSGKKAKPVNKVVPSSSSSPPALVKTPAPPPTQADPMPAPSQAKSTVMNEGSETEDDDDEPPRPILNKGKQRAISPAPTPVYRSQPIVTSQARASPPFPIATDPDATDDEDDEGVALTSYAKSQASQQNGTSATSAPPISQSKRPSSPLNKMDVDSRPPRAISPPKEIAPKKRTKVDDAKEEVERRKAALNASAAGPAKKKVKKKGF